ncbi:transcriptional regulator with XRE-family HTH domain [Streptomyces sp. 3330]|uniref:helix-turn-helix domain-containing protein n=1 Tax=Streptomyces sp. 3330 TaxID=2817755 RepID=UPI0028585328|nr:XRE family transcriptional regulator [Streptomyces sp. 3330]MDR6980516.1 transcriptional regulator with XRE-family HTH domain [Streptomyces sp. 3330]
MSEAAPPPAPRPPSRLPLDWIAAALRRERTRAGLSLSELAKRAGIAKSTLSQLEAASGNPSMETIWALGVALGVPFAALVEPPVSAVRVIRAGEGPAVASEQAPYVATLLSASPPGARRDLYHLRAEPGAVRASEPHIPGTVEHLIVSTGRVKAGPAGETVELGPGDYLTYRGDVPHSYEALAPGTTFVLVMQHV